MSRSDARGWLADLPPVRRLWRPRDDAHPIDTAVWLAESELVAAAAGLVDVQRACSHACTILLGEPGIGKSTELLGFVRQHSGRGGIVQLIELRGFGDEQRLLDELGLGSVSTAAESPEHPVLALDSLDECPMPMGQVIELLKRALPALPRGAHLVVACRTAAWPPILEAVLRGYYTDVGVYELLPLTHSQVAELAAAAGLDPEAFRDAVADARVAPLTVSPNTLKLLLADALSWAGSGPLRLPGGQQELFDRACRRLAAEPNPYRQVSGSFRSPDEVVAVAGYLATIALFSGAAEFWIDPVEESPPGALAPAACGPASVAWNDQESLRVGPLSVDQWLVREVLGTALFAGRGEERLGFVHQTIAEYLAARHLVSAGVPTQQVIALLRGRKGRLAPQVQAVAAWLIALAPDRYGHLLGDDPTAFIRSAVELPDPSYREILVNGLLDLASRYELSDIYGLDLNGLNYPGLAARLTDFLQDRAAPADVRMLAALVARANHLRELVPVLLERTLDDRQPVGLRGLFGNMALELGDLDTHRRLATLTGESADHDPEDELFGLGLSASLRAGTSLGDFLPGLRPPREPDLFGSYRLLLISELPKRIADPRLDTAQLLAALAWAAELEDKAGTQGAVPTPDSSAGRLLDPMEPVLDAILQAGVAGCGDDERLLDATAGLLAVRLEHHSTILHDQRSQLPTVPTNSRHAIVAATRRELRNLSVHQSAAWPLHGVLILAEDLPWLINQALTTTDPEEAADWALYARWAFNLDDEHHIRLVLEIAPDTILYRQGFANWREPVRLDSELADQLRRAHRRSPEPEPEAPSASELRQRLVTILEATPDDDTFTRLCQLLLFRPGQRWAHNQLELDITGLPGWELLDSAQRDLAAGLAGHHLRHADVDPAAYLGTNTIDFRVLAGVRALALLCHTLNQPPELPPDRWALWAPSLVGAPVDTGSQGMLEEALQLAYRHAPEAVQQAASILAHQPDPFGEFPLRRLEPILDVTAIPWLAELAADPSIGRSPAAEALRQLFNHDLAAARRHLDSVLQPSRLTDPAGRERAEDAVVTALATAPTAVWDVVWPVLETNGAFGEAVFLRVAHDRDRVAPALTEQQLVDLWQLLHTRFPPDQDPVVHGGHIITPRESVANLRNRLLPELAQRGNDDATALLRRLVEEHPQLPWLARLAADAEQTARRGDWTPLPARQVVALLAAPERLLLRTSRDLLDAVLDAMHAIQQDLGHGAPPEATLLWNHGPACRGGPGNGCRPKSEDEISDYLAGHLRRHLQHAAVNREVQTQRRAPTGIGERVDLLVEARARAAPHDLVQVAVEVKGCWNREALSGLGDQLVRYLNSLPGSAGLFVVAWFDPAHWDMPGPWTRHPILGQQTNLIAALSNQAGEASSSTGRAIAARILDCSIPT
jgi:hypothetical protein